MNLFFYKDNFLSADDFNKLNQLSIRRYPMIEKEDKYARQNPFHPIRSRDQQLPAGHTSVPPELSLRYGNITVKAIDQIYQFLINDAQVIKPELATVWFAYMNPGQYLDFHCDGPVRDVPVERCVTVCLYIHEHWEEDWGGEIESEEGTKFLPMSNRLIVWSRDVIHRVADIKTTELPFKRAIMASTWTTEGLKPDQ